MEQRIGSSSQPLKNEPVKGAGLDPAFVPGLTSPGSPEPEDAGPETEDAADEAAEAGEAGATVPGGQEDSAPDEPEESAVEETPDGPAFEAADRRARIVADQRGVRLSLDDQSCEFRWDEIGAVETATPRFGKRFTVTVHTPDSRWYPIEIEASARSHFAEWEQQLDDVLDAYFEDGEEGKADEPTEDAETSPQDAETAPQETDSEKPAKDTEKPAKDAKEPAEDAEKPAATATE